MLALQQLQYIVDTCSILLGQEQTDNNIHTDNYNGKM
jgi:hypothetical protein